MKIVINTCFGGFSLSEKACNELGLNNPYDAIERNDPKLVEVVERLGSEANGRHAQLKIVNIPDDVKWTIQEYDGSEHIAEEHQTWY